MMHVKIFKLKYELINKTTKEQINIINKEENMENLEYKVPDLTYQERRYMKF